MSYALLALSLIVTPMPPAGYAQVYEVTGPVIEVRDNFIIVLHGDEKWEIARDFDTRGGLDISAGDTVTVQFTLNARSITRQ